MPDHHARQLSWNLLAHCCLIHDDRQLRWNLRQLSRNLRLHCDHIHHSNSGNSESCYIGRHVAYASQTTHHHRPAHTITVTSAHTCSRSSRSWPSLSVHTLAPRSHSAPRPRLRWLRLIRPHPAGAHEREARSAARRRRRDELYPYQDEPPAPRHAGPSHAGAMPTLAATRAQPSPAAPRLYSLHAL